MRKAKQDGRPVYDDRMRAKAVTTATLRAVVTLYVMYLGSELILHAGEEGTTLPFWAGVAGGVVFILAGAAFGVYIWNRYQAELKEAELLPPEKESGREEPEE